MHKIAFTSQSKYTSVVERELPDGHVTLMQRQGENHNMSAENQHKFGEAGGDLFVGVG